MGARPLSHPGLPEPVAGRSFFALLRTAGSGFGTLGQVGVWALLAVAAILLPACSSMFAKSPAEQYEAGVEAWREGRVREARIALRNALQGDSGNKDAHLLQTRLLLESGDGEGAEAAVARARQAGATGAETRHLMAHARLLQGDADGAIQQAEGAAPDQASYAARVIALAQLAKGDQVLAVRAFDRAIAADPKNAYAWVDIARFRRSLGDIGPAIHATDKAVEADPKYAPALVLRGELTRQQYGLTAAVPWFDRAIEIDSGNVPALIERASTYADMGRMTAMLADSRAAAALEPDNPTPYLLQAVLAARGRDFALSRSLLARTRGAFDALPSAILLQSVLSYESRDYEDAARRLAQLVQMQPGNVKARRLLAAARLKLNDADGAIDAVRFVADRPDADSYTLSLVADALEKTGNRALASRYRMRAARPEESARTAYLWSSGSHPEIRAIAELLAAGNRDGALDRARALQRAMPGAAEVYLALGDVLTARGDQRGAAEQYRRAANLTFNEASAVRLIGALGRAGDGQAADAVLELFAVQHPRNVSGQLILAQRALAAGQYDEAVSRYERLRARLGNGDAALLNNLAWAYLGTGDAEQAAAYARRAWALAPGNSMTAHTLGWALYRGGDTVRGLALIQGARRGDVGGLWVEPVRTAGN